MLPLITAILIVLADQATKQAVQEAFIFGEQHAVLDGFFNLTYLRNTGAAWGMLGGQNFSLTILSLVVLLVMVVFRRQFLGNTWDHRLALGLMCGGIVGNMLDRIRLGYVVDFLDFHIGTAHWPAFNIADSAICVGVGIYLVTSIAAPHRSPHYSPPARRDRPSSPAS